MALLSENLGVASRAVGLVVVSVELGFGNRILAFATAEMFGMPIFADSGQHRLVIYRVSQKQSG